MRNTIFISCIDLIHAGLYPSDTRCCRNCHKCSSHRIIVSAPDKETGDYTLIEDYETGMETDRVMLAFCCNVGFVSLSREEIARMAWFARARDRATRSEIPLNEDMIDGAYPAPIAQA